MDNTPQGCRESARGVLSFDLPVRPIRQAHSPEALEGQAQGPEALDGEALDRWYRVNVTDDVLR